MSHHEPQHSDQHGGHAHHILPYATGVKIFIALLVFTVITVAAARVDLGMFNFAIAMFIATCKALMVVLLFMGLKYDNNENRVIFFTSFIFVAIFVCLTATDLFFRGDVKVKPDVPFAVGSSVKSKFKQPWNSTPEIVAHGKGLFDQQCVSCHGATGHGDGIAAAALNPKPRNFTQTEGWKNGRKPSIIFKTLKTGLNQMPSFASLSAEDRWTLAHYVASLNPEPLKDTDADFKAAGVDPNAAGAGGDEDKTISVESAIELMSEDGKL